MKIEYKPKSLADQVYERLEDGILSGEYAIGEILTEKRLAAELGVSRTPIREAIAKLEFDNLVEITTGGVEVRGINRDDVDELYEVKRKLEPLVVKLAAEKMTDEDIEALKDVVDEQQYFAGKDDTLKVRNLDTRFHDIIYMGCGSLVYSGILSGVHHKLKKYRRSSLKNEDRIRNSVVEHEEIYKAIKKRDGDKAAKLIAKHIENAYASVKHSEE